jgi:hypothetical protein
MHITLTTSLTMPVAHSPPSRPPLRLRFFAASSDTLLHRVPYCLPSKFLCNMATHISDLDIIPRILCPRRG